MAKLERIKGLEVTFILDPRKCVKHGEEDEYYPAVRVITGVCTDTDGTKRRIYEREFLGSPQSSPYTLGEVKSLLANWNNMNTATVTRLQSIYDAQVTEVFE